jgi:hypothetical protein
MALYDGFPSIQLEGDQRRALALIPEAKALLYTVQQVRDNSGAGTFSMSRAVGEDAYIYALSSQGINKLVISVAVEVPEQINPEPETHDGILAPDFLSGIVVNGFLEERSGDIGGIAVCAVFAPTPNCQETAKLGGGYQLSERLAVEPGPAFDFLRSNSSLPFTQYTRLRPSMYSGTMRKVVQVVMGLGRMNITKLRDPRAPGPLTPYMKNVRDYGVQVRYDWRFIRTHGITKASDGSLWLVEISPMQGVIATKLPIFPNSDTPEFFAAAEARGDKAMATALLELGCLPTGEAFPTIGRMEEAIRTGKVLRLLPAAGMIPFFECSAYSSYMGWCFNSSGSEAHNTAYKYDEVGFQQGVWYQLNIDIQVVSDVPTGSASLRRISSGAIYTAPTSRTNRARYVPFKCYEPLVSGLLSHEGVGLETTRGKPPPEVDTVMFVMFVNDEVKTVRYFREAVASGYHENSDGLQGEDCPYDGAWSQRQTSGVTTLPTMMYTNDYDDRRVLFGVDIHTRFTSARIGYDPPNYYDFVEAPSTSLVQRRLVFRNTIETTTRNGDRMFSAVIVPEYSREAYYYTVAEEAAEGANLILAVSYSALADPNIGFAWRCWPGTLSALPDRPDCDTRKCRGDAPCSNGVGFPKSRMVACLGRFEVACSDIADSGPWLADCQNVDGFNQPAPERPTGQVNTHLGNLQKAKLVLVTQGYNGPILLTTSFANVDELWLNPSPDPVSGSTQNIQVTHNAIGSDTAVYNQDLGYYDAIIRGYSPASVGPGDKFPTFIGVVQP